MQTPNILITPDGHVKLADFGLGNRYGLQRLRTICGNELYPRMIGYFCFS